MTTGADRILCRRLGVASMALLLALTLLAVAPPASAQPPPEVTRIDGGAEQPDDVRAVAVATCQALLPDDGTATRVLVSRDDAFADALAASALAGDDACILFTGAAPADLDPAVRAEIDRVLPAGGQVELLGGTAAVSPGVEGELTAAGYTVRRHEGTTRYETAAAIAEVVRAEAASDGPADFAEVILAWGEDWPDAVTAGAYAAAQGAPIVLTQTDGLHSAAAAFLASGPVTRTTVVGGTAVISDQAADAAPNPLRIAGDNRMGTAATITSSLWPTAGATGIDFTLVNLEHPDAWTLALAAAPLSAQLGAPQLGVRVDGLPDETAEFLDTVGTDGLERPPTLTVMGSEAFVTQTVTQQVASRLGGEDPTPPAGICDPALSDAPAELPAEADPVWTEQVEGDIDGDGVPDQLSTYRLDGDGGPTFFFHVLTANGYATQFELDADSIAHVRPLGTAAIGTGRPAAFVVEQVGATGTIFVATIGLHDTPEDPCSLDRITIPDDTAGLNHPIGNGNGLECRDEGGAPALIVQSVQPQPDPPGEEGLGGPQVFDWLELGFTWPGAFELLDVEGFPRTGTFTTPGDEDQVEAFSTLDCPGVEAP